MQAEPDISARQREAEAQFYAGVAWLGRDALTEAEACFRAAIGLDSSLAPAHANLAWLLERRGALDLAEQAYLACAALDPSLQENQLNLGALYTVQKRFQAAEQCLAQALMADNTKPAVWSNLGALYLCWQREDEAEECLRHAMALDAQYAKPRFNLSYLLLRQGRYAEGWACMEARDWYHALEKRLPCPRWQGEDLTGKSVLIGFEAGHGDMLQMCRYAAVLKGRGAARVDLLCHPALRRLFESLDGVDTVLPFDADLPGTHWDCWTPPFSIPFHCGTRLDSIPARLPYLHAEPALQARWAPSCPPRGLKVGLVWKGSTSFENDADRSLPGLATLAALWQVPGVQFVSLQKGAGEDEARKPPAGQPVLDLGSQLRDFADAAAILCQLDLLITVDTAMAHLAGALGRPCWLMLPHHKTDWRWLTERSDSPWYPQALRLFRQTRDGEWAPVVEALRLALAERADGAP